MEYITRKFNSKQLGGRTIREAFIEELEKAYPDKVVPKTFKEENPSLYNAIYSHLFTNTGYLARKNRWKTMGNFIRGSLEFQTDIE